MTIRLIFPVSGPITQNFGENPAFYQKWGYPGHNGIDFGIANGTPVLSAAQGVVDKVSFEDGGYGNYVKLRHTDGAATYYTYYCHLMHATVSSGQTIQVGVAIGQSNNTGASTGPHLHFGLRMSDTSTPYKGYVDPLPYLTGGGSGASGASGSPDGIVALPNLKFEVLLDELNVRNGPGLNYSKVGVLTKGKVVTTTKLFSDGAWIEIEPGKWCAVTFAGVQNMKVK